MRMTTCPQLKTLAQILMTAYLRRSSAVEEGDALQIARAGENLRNVHKLITQHRHNCSRCKAIEVPLLEADRQLPSSMRTFWEMDRTG